VILRISLVVSLLLACALAAAIFQWPPPAPSMSPMSVGEDGIGPLRLGRDFPEAEHLAFRAAPQSAFSGVGCAGFNEIRYDGWLGENFVGVMAMGNDDRIETVEVTLHQPTPARNQYECLLLRDRFAETFVSRLGPFESSGEVIKPVSRETLARTGPVLITARWFDTGSGCYVSARYGAFDDDFGIGAASVTPGE